MAEPGRVVVLTNRQLLHYFLIRRLAEHFDVALVIYERPGPAQALRLLARRARRLGYGTVLAQIAYIGWDRWVVRPRSAGNIRRLLNDYNADPPGRELPQVEVNSINSDEAARSLEAVRPAVCVVSGTSIIKPPILEKAAVFLNVHAGITPRYRGAHGAFWAIWEGRPELAGVTVHLIDAGVDTGGIVAQVPIPVAVDDTPRTLVAKQYLAAVPAVIQAVRQALDGTLAAGRRDDLESRLWYPPTPLAYLRFRRQLQRLEREGRLATTRQRTP